MCGIAWCLLQLQQSEESSIYYHNNDDVRQKQGQLKNTHASESSDIIIKLLANTLTERGPDFPSKIHSICLNSSEFDHCEGVSTSFECCVIASVLHLRGEHGMPQPVSRRVTSMDVNGDHIVDEIVLAWNGECYDGPCDVLVNDEICSDTNVVLELLISAISSMPQECILEKFTRVMGDIKGEYAFICHHIRKINYGCIEHNVYYARDPMGRRSLMLHRRHDTDSEKMDIILSSVIPPKLKRGFEEITPGFVHSFEIKKNRVIFPPKSLDIPRLWLDVLSSAYKIDSIINFEGTLENCDETNISASMLNAACGLYKVLSLAVRRRVLRVPRKYENDASVGILFSGGLDSVVLAALAHQHIPESEQIDLINIAFSGKPLEGRPMSTYSGAECPDRLAAILSYKELKTKWPSRSWHFISVDVGYDEVLEHEEKICSLIHPCDTQMDFNIGAAFYFASAAKGWSEGHVYNTYSADSNVLRFSDKKKNKTKLTKMCDMTGCDKKSLSNCVFRACRFCCGCYQKPIKAFLGAGSNICYAHYSTSKAEKKKCISSISNEKGKKMLGISSSNKLSHFPQRTTSQVKVLLLGIGADEQMAGYSRHRTVYNKGGYKLLEDELLMEKARIWRRNLGRDDRCISASGKEARFPFLDEDVVSFLENTSIYDICDMNRKQGEGDKMILRIVARLLGLEVCQGLVKRAIQFGSRIAKSSDIHQFGSSKNATGTATYKLKRT